MSVRRNIIANYGAQLYAAGVSILFVPLYIRYMGVEAYGLVGFYAMLQGWFVLLDMGLTPTVSRETSRFAGGAIDAFELRRLFRSLEGIFLTTAIAAALMLMLLSGPTADSWLQVEGQDIADVKRAICLMAVVVSLRWICGLYRGAVIGFERFVWLSGFSVVVATLRFALIVPYLIYVGATPTHFFAYQLVIAIAEVAVLVLYTYRLLPGVEGTRFIRWEWQPVRRVARFTLSAAITSAIWVFVSQTDKLILSGLISLTDYAYFTLAVVVASSITLLSSPLTAAILPRLTSLHAQAKEADLTELYRSSTQVVCVICLPIVLLLALFPEPILFAWTSNPAVTHAAAPILSLYAVGNGLLALITFPYYLQLARGELKLHLAYSGVFFVVFVPLLTLAVMQYGVIGAGYAWIGANLFPFLAWLPIVHGRFLPGMHLRWVLKDILAVAALPTLAAFLLQAVVTWPGDRFWILAEMAPIGLSLVVLAALSSSVVRRYVAAHLTARDIFPSIRSRLR